MTRDAIRALQLLLSEAGHDPGPIDGLWGRRTEAAVTGYLRRQQAPPASGLRRIIWHWTGGSHNVSTLDRRHYHFVISGEGEAVAGDYQPEDNISTADGLYAAHTLNANTGAIGIAVAAMHGARERPFDPGAWPIREAQVDALVRISADLARRYGIPVTPTTMLSHAEVQPALGIAQRGKWDITWLPDMAAPVDPVAIGNILRGRVAAAMKGD